MINRTTYDKLQELKLDGLNKSQITRRLNIDINTVCKYWDMPADIFDERAVTSVIRPRKSEKYRAEIIDCLNNFPEMSSPQIYKRICKVYGMTSLDVKPRAFSTYVTIIKKEMGIA